MAVACLCALMPCAPASAQTAFERGDKVVNAGIGLPTYLGGTGYKLTMPLFSSSFEYGIVDDLIDGKAAIGVGGYLGYTANKYEYLSDKGIKYTYFILGARGAFHYSPLPRLDTYAGVMLGYDVINSSYYGDYLSTLADGRNSGEVAYSTFIGVRYFFSAALAVYSEIGYGIAPIEAGIAIRF